MKKVLIVDPEPEILEVFNIILTENSYISLLTDKYENVLQLVEQQKPDLIFIDVYNQQEACKKVCATIKNHPDHKERQ